MQCEALSVRSMPPIPESIESRTSLSSTRHRMRHRVWAVLAIALLASGIWFVHARQSHSTAGNPPQGAGRGGGAPQGARPIPVQVATVKRGDVNVYLSGLLGTATALNTVTVHTRVDGQLVTVAFHEGQFVHEGDVLAEIDPRPFQVQLEQAQGQLRKDEAQLQNAKLDLERYKVLYSQDSVAKQQLDTQQATVTQDEGVITTDQAQIDTAKLNLAYCRVTAPLSGRIGLRLVDPGNIVHAADPNGLVVITQVQPIAVVFPIPEDALPRVLPKIRAGQTMAVDAFDRDPVKPKLLATGSVLSLDNQVDVATGTVKVKAQFKNTDETLFPNQFVNARLHVDTLRQVLILPSAAVERGPQSTFVFVVKSDGSADMRNVDVQLTQGDETVVKSGVAEGDTVVTDGLDKLQPGTRVQARPASEAPASGGRQ
jgi:membrane fusion protein, multidrug efflux system